MTTEILACPLPSPPKKILSTSGSNPEFDPFPGGLWWIGRNLRLRTTRVPPIYRGRTLQSSASTSVCRPRYLGQTQGFHLRGGFGRLGGNLIFRSPLGFWDSWNFVWYFFTTTINEGTMTTINNNKGTFWWQRRHVWQRRQSITTKALLVATLFQDEDGKFSRRRHVFTTMTTMTMMTTKARIHDDDNDDDNDDDQQIRHHNNHWRRHNNNQQRRRYKDEGMATKNAQRNYDRSSSANEDDTDNE